MVLITIKKQRKYKIQEHLIWTGFLYNSGGHKMEEPSEVIFYFSCANFKQMCDSPSYVDQNHVLLKKTKRGLYARVLWPY